jgi:cytochrome b6-f complex iron-sulfur subunit
MTEPSTEGTSAVNPTPAPGAAPAAAAAPKPAAAATKPVAKKAAAKPVDPTVTRRKLAWWAVFGTIAVWFGATLRFFFPRVLFEPSTRFPIGYPADYGFGVDTKWQQAKRVWVVKQPGRLFVIFARCTHLGCTPDWKETDSKFKCPCHGSGFDVEGVNFEGPAPQPLLRCHVEIDARGQIIVDSGRQYKVDEWGKEGAYLVA